MKPGAFTPDRDSAFYLLARHRQPLAANVAREYIESLTAPGDLVIDPFAASPTTARVAVELGRRAIAVDSNPLVAFAARIQAALPPPREIATALARLGEVRKEDESLKAHVEGLYASVCANCGVTVNVEYFVHTQELKAPVEKVYSCPNCGVRRDPTNEADRARATEFKARGFHYHLLLERIVGSEGEHTPLLRDLLRLYTPRNLYALVSITLKLEAEFKEERTRQILTACLIHALDVGTTLYSSPDSLPQRKTPDRFVEVNVWHALETAAAGFSRAAPGPAPAKSPAEVTDATTPGLFVGSGSAHSLAEMMSAGAMLVLSSPARLDPLFWQLSYLWARWTLGRAAAHPLEPLLEAERQRWGWYGSALTAALRDAARLMRSEGRMAFCFPAGSHAMIEALCLAAAPLFQLESLAFRPHRGAVAASEFGALRGDYRGMWRRREANAATKGAGEVGAKLRRSALVGATSVLAARAEPVGYSWVHHGALAQLANDGILAETQVTKLSARDNAFLFLRRELEAGLKEGYARDLDHWGESGRVLWMRRQPGRDGVPLVDRVETSVREILAVAKRIAPSELEDQVLARFPAPLTPEIELVETCAAAYADMFEGEWRWRQVDVDAELARAVELVAKLGARLDFHLPGGAAGVSDSRPPTGRFDLVWRDEKVVPGSSRGGIKEIRVQEDSHAFIFRARVDLRGLVDLPATPLRGLVVIPETQVGLTREKLRRQPPLLKPLREAGWEFLRVPFVEMLLGSSSVERAEFQLAVGLDPPIAQGKEQMELF
jgi:hypothetical protein